MIKTDYNNDMKDAEKYDKTGKWIGRLKKGIFMIVVSILAGKTYSSLQENKNEDEPEDEETKNE